MEFRELEDEEKQTCIDIFYYILEETQDTNECVPSNYNIHLFKCILNMSFEFGIKPFVVIDNNNIIACNIILDICSFELKHKSVFSFGTWTREDYRHKGIMKKLTKYAFEKLKEKGIEKIYGQFYMNRTSSQKYMEEMGIETIHNACKVLK